MFPPVMAGPHLGPYAGGMPGMPGFGGPLGPVRLFPTLVYCEQVTAFAD